MFATAIKFQVNLTTLNNYSAKQPYNLSTQTANLPNTRSTWFPNQLLNNRQLKHGDIFTAYDLEALYLYNNFTSGPYAFLIVLSNIGGTTAHAISASSSSSSTSGNIS